MHYYQWNIGDYASHTRHLSPIEDIAYRRLLDLAYTTELPLIKDTRQLSRLVNLREYEQEIIDILNEFFFEVHDGWVSNRVLKEIEKTGKKSESARNSVAKRWDNERKEKDKESIRTQYERNTNVPYNDTNVTKNDTTHNPLHITHNPLPITQLKTVVAQKTRPSKKPPTDFAITNEMREWAKSKVPHVNIDFETESFLDHEFAKAKSDWQGTWRNWMRRTTGTKPPEIRKDKSPADRVMRLYGESQQNQFLELSHE